MKKTKTKQNKKTKQQLTLLNQLVLNACQGTHGLKEKPELLDSDHRPQEGTPGLGRERARRTFLNSRPPLTAADVTEDLLKSRSASLNLRFLRSFLLLEFLKHTEGFLYDYGSSRGGPRTDAQTAIWF